MFAKFLACAAFPPFRSLCHGTTQNSRPRATRNDTRANLHLKNGSTEFRTKMEQMHTEFHRNAAFTAVVSRNTPTRVHNAVNLVAFNVPVTPSRCRLPCCDLAAGRPSWPVLRNPSPCPPPALRQPWRTRNAWRFPGTSVQGLRMSSAGRSDWPCDN